MRTESEGGEMGYQKKIELAEKYSKQLGISPRLYPHGSIDVNNIQILDDLCNSILPDMISKDFQHKDWSTQCMNVAPHLFNILQEHNIPCELTYGEVKIGGIAEFGTLQEELIKEWNKGKSQEPFAIHVWLTIGRDYIIDPTISSRIFNPFHSHYRKNIIVSGKADHLKESLQLKYIPMLLGAKYIEKICGISLDYKMDL